MSYQHEHIPLLTSKEGYNRLYKKYASYHKQLSARDESLLKRYLPRSLHAATIVDAGGGDGRRAKILRDSNFSRWIIVDNAEKLLDQAPGRVEKCCSDLEEVLPLASNSVDFILSSFVMLHVQHLDMFFSEARRIIKESGRMLLFHHHERRPFVHQDDESMFKIVTYHRRFEEIEEMLDFAGWQVDVFSPDNFSRIYSCFPRPT